MKYAPPGNQSLQSPDEWIDKLQVAWQEYQDEVASLRSINELRSDEAAEWDRQGELGEQVDETNRRLGQLEADDPWIAGSLEDAAELHSFICLQVEEIQRMISLAEDEDQEDHREI